MTGVAAMPSALDPRTPPMALLPLVGPDASSRPAVSEPDAIAYCRGLATSHYENFSVLTSLVPERLRDDFAAVYAFCRWADDLGDETGNTPEARATSERLLAWWKRELRACFQDDAASVSHPVFVALRSVRNRHPVLTLKPFEDLIDAFVQDQRVMRYDSWEQVLDYCTRSANPVGRIVLMLGGYAPPEVDSSNTERFIMSDATCTALQLINFWQDVRRDLLERDRIYIPVIGPDGPTGITPDLLRDWMLRPEDPRARVPFIRAMRPLVDRTEELFRQGEPLPKLLSKDLAPVVWLFGAGGRCILSRVRQIGCATLWHRPTVTKADKAMLMARAYLRAKLGR